MVSFERLKQITEMVNEKGLEFVAEFEGLSIHTVSDYVNRYKRACADDPDVVIENVRLAKKLQKNRDTNRIERKAFREQARKENAIEELGRKLNENYQLYSKNLSKFELPNIEINQTDKIGVIQLSDLHGNELINLPHNRFDFEILSKRLHKLAEEAIFLFNTYNIKNIKIIHTGDALNSDRRLDEILNQATNRAKAVILMQHLICQFIMHLRQYFNIKVVSVIGNESRANQEMSFSAHSLSNNYDFLIFEGVKKIFEFANIPDVSFSDMDQLELLVNIADQKWLVAHDISKFTAKQEKTQATIGRYALSGIHVDFIIGGHIHGSRITDISARSSSMPGSNEYNENALNLHGRAAQNIFVVDRNTRRSIVVDLQFADDYEGYEIVKELEAYHAKSADKAEQKTVIFQVVT